MSTACSSSRGRGCCCANLCCYPSQPHRLLSSAGLWLNVYGVRLPRRTAPQPRARKPSTSGISAPPESSTQAAAAPAEAPAPLHATAADPAPGHASAEAANPSEAAGAAAPCNADGARTVGPAEGGGPGDDGGPGEAGERELALLPAGHAAVEGTAAEGGAPAGKRKHRRRGALPACALC